MMARRYELRPVALGLPTLDLVRLCAMLETEGADAKLAFTYLMATDPKRDLLHWFAYFREPVNRPEWRRVATAVRAQAARDQAKHDDVMRHHYGAFELEPFPRRAFRLIDGGKIESASTDIVRANVEGAVLGVHSAVRTLLKAQRGKPGPAVELLEIEQAIEHIGYHVLGWDRGNSAWSGAVDHQPDGDGGRAA